MDDLIKRLEAATEGSRELDADIQALQLGGHIKEKSDGGLLVVVNGMQHGLSWSAVARYTTSLDAKLPWEDDLWWSIRSPNGFAPYDKWEAVACWPNGADEFIGKAKTEPLARRIAALKAKQCSG